MGNVKKKWPTAEFWGGHNLNGRQRKRMTEENEG